MTTLLILCTIIAILFFIYRKTICTLYSEWVAHLSIFLIIIFIGMLITHCIGWASASYNYGIVKLRRDSFQETLNAARKNGNQFEVAAITKDIIEFNERLAIDKYDLTIPFLKDYIDARVNHIQPIK